MAGRRKCKHSETEALLREVEALLGADAISGGGNRHYKVKVPGHGLVVVAATPSDHHAAKNARARLRRRGLKI